MAVPVPVNTSAANHASALVFSRTLDSRVLAIPGIESLAYAGLQPFRGAAPPTEIRLPGQATGQGNPASVDDVSSSFFATFGIPMIKGRTFSSADPTSATADSVAVVSQAFARKFWPASDPLGKAVTTPDNHRLIVVGVAADTESETFGVIDGPRLYTFRDSSALGGSLYVHFAGDSKAVENAVRDTVRGLDHTLIIAPETLWEVLEDDAAIMRSLAGIILMLASIGLLMAISGVYGVLSFAANQRAREYGIRMVLGANRGTIFGSVTLQAVRNTIFGLICGAALAEPAVWGLKHMLSGSPLPLRGLDTFVFGVSALLLAVVTLAATWLPALRAMRVDPIVVLRAE